MIFSIFALITKVILILSVFKKIVSFCFVLLTAVCAAWSTHIRAGEITAVRTTLQSLSYQFTLVLYMSDAGTGIQDNATLYCSDGWNSGEVVPSSTVGLGNNTTRMTFVFNHTFAAPGQYDVWFLDRDRIAGINNIGNGASQVAFFIESSLTIDPFIGLNNSPILLVPPIDDGSTGQVYNYNPGAYDPDGDSLAYELVIPLMDSNLVVPSYESPGLPKFSGGPNAFSLDPSNGNLVWDYPDVAGLYNVAYKVKEYRNGFLIGYVTRDMQIRIWDNQNIKPELSLPQNLCRVAGDTMLETIFASDADNDNIEMTAFGGILDVTGNPASFTQNTTANPASGTFSWIPSCSDVRHQPHQVVFKANDRLSKNPSLVDIEVWEIKVYGPPPTNLVSSKNTDPSITLTWDNYECDNAAEIEIWRKDCSAPTDIECDDDLASYGYVKVGSVASNTTSYTDDDNGVGLKNGRSYCYRLVARFEDPQGGVSIPSEETCENNGDEHPFMLNVSVEKTDATNGEIFVRWTNRIVGGPAPKYRLYRALGENPAPAAYTLMSILPDDTSFTDTGLNTLDNQYSYYAKIVDAEASDHASSVRLEAIPSNQRVDLSWHADVPWSITGGLQHDIYRKYEAKGDIDFVLIDSIYPVNEAQLVYTDTGQYLNISLNDEDSVCYYVLTRGSYCNDKIVDNEVLLNKSQEICVIPQDTIPPCPPTLSVETECIELWNDLTWSPVVEPKPCYDDIAYYEVHRKPGLESTYTLIATTSDTTYFDDSLNFVSGCYQIHAVDVNGNKGQFSDSVCVSDCPRFVLPNIFSPNGDDFNAVFTPIPPIRAINKVDLTVYNRWGKKVYEFSGDPEINWDGGDLSDGLYFYKVNVETFSLNEDEREQKFKGWVQIVR